MFSLGTFSIAGSPPFAGVVVNERVMRVSDLIGKDETVFGLLQDWENNMAALHAAVAQLVPQPVRFSLSADLQAQLPVQYPRQIFCAGANYRQHVIDLVMDQPDSPHKELPPAERRAFAEKMMDDRAAKGTPYVFTKIVSCLTGPYDAIKLPKDATQPDWELELCVVIGKPAWRVSRENALSYVAGYTIANDVTNRAKVHRQDMKAIGSDWLAGKCAPTFLPVGPYLVPAVFVPDPQALRITLKLNGEVMQDEDTSDMIFDVARLIEYTSHLAQLLPGDLLLTGSPKGNGTHYNRYLRPGDVMEGSITGLGMMRNRCVGEL